MAQASRELEHSWSHLSILHDDLWLTWLAYGVWVIIYPKLELRPLKLISTRTENMKYLLQSHLCLAAIHYRKQKINTFLLPESILVLSKLLWVQSPKKEFEMDRPPMYAVRSLNFTSFFFPISLDSELVKVPRVEATVVWSWGWLSVSNEVLIGSKVPSHLMLYPWLSDLMILVY